MNILISNTKTLQREIANFERIADNGAEILSSEVGVNNLLAEVYQAITSSESTLTDCDFMTLIGLLGDFAPTFVSALQSLVNDYSAIVNATFYNSYIHPMLKLMTANAVQLVNTVYSSLPGCKYAGGAVDALDGIVGAVATAQQIYGLSASTSFIEPVLCPTSTTGASTPTSPPTCKKPVAA
ncbi:hypothetical protein TRVA0_048S00386 [Trichomonascus vanleenenianus]|uniref:uncharacterized protein n=1 Tax=Trichomonascus vanleenenianus TaxID=2268995 RepID=UPI003ECB809E